MALHTTTTVSVFLMKKNKVYHKIGLLQDLSENSRLLKPYKKSPVSLNACSKRPIFNVLSSILSQIRTFECKSEPFPDQFLEKSPDPDQSPGKKN